ncbi:MAG: hypothetical protein H6978_06115 [Gammaproteobacteria bacterium]|nr:hypothetical protein [Gammaproteobacteria bacterium]
MKLISTMNETLPMMNRRRFVGSLGCVTSAAAVASLVPAVVNGHAVQVMAELGGMRSDDFDGWHVDAMVEGFPGYAAPIGYGRSQRSDAHVTWYDPMMQLPYA